MTDHGTTIAYMLATAAGIAVAYHFGKFVGFVQGHKRGRSEIIGLDNTTNPGLDSHEWR